MTVLQELLDLCDDGDTSLVAELIEMFLGDGPAHLRAILAGVDAGDLEQVERSAHSLKGSSGNLGAIALMRTAEALMLESRAGAGDRVRALAPQLEVDYAEAAEALGELLARYANG